MRWQEELVSPRRTKEDLIGLRGGQPGKVMFHLCSLRQLPIGSPPRPCQGGPSGTQENQVLQG